MSTRQMRSNRPMLLTGRRATLAIAVAALGLGAGSSLAEAADDVGTTTEVTAAEVTALEVIPTESLVIELVIEAPPVEEPTADQPANDLPEGDGTQEDTPDTAVTSEPAPAPEPLAEPSPDTEQPVTDALETTTTTEPPDADHDPETGEGGHEDGTEGGHDGGEGGPEDGPEGGHEDGTEGGHDGGTEGGHDGGEGGQQGEGNPYRMTFSVDWRSDDGTPIAVLDNVLPDDWRTVFELTGASRTGRNQPTSALCTYESGDQLVCEFDNPGHRSSADGMIVPARPTATYTVTVEWKDPDWTIDGANAGPYSARDLCPRGGHGGGHDGGHDTGHEDGHDSGHESLTEGEDGQGGDTFLCEHVVVIQQIAVVTPEPEPPTEPGAPDTDEAQAALSPVAPASTPTPRTLPATGSSISLMLAIGTALAAAGVGLALITRRATPDPIGGPGEDRGRMRP